MSDLLPCPFCGGVATLFRSYGPMGRYYIECCDNGGCHSTTKNCKTAQEAADAWNTRAERTCHWEWSEFGNEPDTWEGWDCSVCGEMGDELSEIPNFCPSCGAKVIDE
jgi:Lar family restriction alleviation protein